MAVLRRTNEIVTAPLRLLGREIEALPLDVGH
jgi:hypothetical protein